MAPNPNLRERVSAAFAALTVRADEETGQPPAQPPMTAPARRAAGRSTVTTTEAFSLSMVYRAVQILKTSVKQLSLGTYRGDERISSPLFVRRPDAATTRSGFLEQTVVSLACAGNAYWRIRRFLTGDGAPGGVMSLEVLNPLGVIIHRTDTGKITSYEFPGGPTLKPDEVQHLRLLRVPGTPYGLGPIQAAQVELRGAIDLRDYSANWLEESGVPSGVLTSDQIITDDVARQTKERWNDTQGARKGVAVLGNGLSYETVYLSPADAQFLESRQFDVTQIARLFGVPSSLMLATVEGSTDTYQNVAQDWLGFVRFALMDYLIEIEDAFTELLPRGQEAKFNVEALLRSDTTTRYGAHRTALEAGFMTVNEVRGIENLARFDDPAADIPAALKTKEPVNA